MRKYIGDYRTSKGIRPDEWTIVVEDDRIPNLVRHLKLEDSLKIRNHSPDGFCWGYGGSGPHQTALAILLDVASEQVAKTYYHDFTSEIISKLDKNKGWQLYQNTIEDWIKNKRYSKIVKIEKNLTIRDLFDPSQGEVSWKQQEN